MIDENGWRMQNEEAVEVRKWKNDVDVDGTGVDADRKSVVKENLQDRRLTDIAETKLPG